MMIATGVLAAAMLFPTAFRTVAECDAALATATTNLVGLVGTGAATGSCKTLSYQGVSTVTAEVDVSGMDDFLVSFDYRAAPQQTERYPTTTTAPYLDYVLDHAAKTIYSVTRLRTETVFTAATTMITNRAECEAFVQRNPGESTFSWGGSGFRWERLVNLGWGGLPLARHCAKQPTGQWWVGTIYAQTQLVPFARRDTRLASEAKSVAPLRASHYGEPVAASVDECTLALPEHTAYYAKVLGTTDISVSCDVYTREDGSPQTVVLVANGLGIDNSNFRQLVEQRYLGTNTELPCRGEPENVAVTTWSEVGGELVANDHSILRTKVTSQAVTPATCAADLATLDEIAVAFSPDDRFVFRCEVGDSQVSGLSFSAPGYVVPDFSLQTFVHHFARKLSVCRD